jgi:hypothetical protein
MNQKTREREGKKPGDDKCGRKKRVCIEMYELTVLVGFIVTLDYRK